MTTPTFFQWTRGVLTCAGCVFGVYLGLDAGNSSFWSVAEGLVTAAVVWVLTGTESPRPTT